MNKQKKVLTLSKTALAAFFDGPDPINALTKITFPTDIDSTISASQIGFLQQSNLDMKALPAPIFPDQYIDDIGEPAMNEHHEPTPFEANQQQPLFTAKFQEMGSVKVCVVPYIVRNNDLTLRESLIW